MADNMMRTGGRGEDGKAKAFRTNNQGDQYVQLMGSTTLKVTLAESQQIRDIEQKSAIIPSDIDAYGNFDIEISNTLDQPIYIGFSTKSWNAFSVMMTDGSVKRYSPYIGTGNVYHIIPPNVTGVFLSSSVLQDASKYAPFKDYRGEFKVMYRCPVAPTSGQVTMKLQGTP